MITGVVDYFFQQVFSGLERPGLGKDVVNLGTSRVYLNLKYIERKKTKNTELRMIKTLASNMHCGIIFYVQNYSACLQTTK